MSQARYEAYKLLKQIIQEEEYSNLTLRKQLESIDPEQRPMITRLVYGTIENYRLVRYCWERYVKVKPKEELAILLDLSVYQLLLMDHQAPYAVIDEMVEIAKRKIPGNGTGLVNAILRKVADQKIPPMPSDDDEALSIRTSHPLWLIKMWNAQYGNDICKRICEGNLQPRRSVGRVNTLKISREELLRQEPLFQASCVSEDGVIFQGSSIAHTSWYQDGYVAIQDEASQMVASFVEPQKEDQILDVCSAPGTKACHMAQKMQNQGMILCGDIHEHRVALIKAGAQRLGITCIQAEVMDATIYDASKASAFDRVLCDVPCSGYGTLSRKSDIKLRMQSSDMDSLIPLQAQILNISSQYVKPKGYLVYSTCTLNKKENEKQIERFLKEHQDWVLIDQTTIFPFDYECDGFFMAKLQKA